MTALWNHTLALSHLLLDWLLVFPRDLRIGLLALLTGGLLLLARKFLTHQRDLELMAADLKVLRRLTSSARKNRDKSAKVRYRQNTLALRQRMLNAQLPAILAALIPLVLAGAWAQDTLLMTWPTPGQTATVRLVAPATAAGQLAHLIPGEGLASKRPITRLDADANLKDAASASWDVTVAGAGPVRVTVRCGAQTIEHVLSQRNGALYGNPRQVHDDDRVTIISMPETRLLGLVPGWHAAGIPAWAMGYLLCVLLAYPVLKKLLRVH